MAELSAKSFMKNLERSGIVADDKLKALKSRLKKIFNGQKVTTSDLIPHLIDAELITEWHCEKLLAGKYKGFFLGKYKLLGHLGTGGMSSVFLAEHKLSGQKRAIKVLPRKKVPDKSYLDRFYREGKAAASLNHPNIVRIYDICNEADTHYMVMEWVKGNDLYEIVKDNGAMDFNDAAKATIQACKGLDHAHERNMVHRDIKPANLLRTLDGDVKILDLGLALLRQSEEESLTILHNERVMGTADYLSPEQAVNSHEVDHRADIYSLGCTLYYMLTGHPPFPTGSLAQRIAMHQTQEPESILNSRSDCPPPLVKLVETLMHKSPEQRPQSCRRVSEMLTEYCETGSITFDESIAIDTSHRRNANPEQGDNDPSLSFSATDQSDAATALSASPFAIDQASGSGMSGKSGTGGNAAGRRGSSKSGKKYGRPGSNANEAAIPTVTSGLSARDTDVEALSRAVGPAKKRKQKGIPVWALAAMILLMFTTLLIVLGIVFSFIDTGPTTPAGPDNTSRSISIENTFTDFV